MVRPVTLARASNVIEVHRLLDEVQADNNKKFTDSEQYISDEAYLQHASQAEHCALQFQNSHRGHEASVITVEARLEMHDMGVQTSEPIPKRRRISIEVSTETSKTTGFTGARLFATVSRSHDQHGRTEHYHHPLQVWALP